MSDTDMIKGIRVLVVDDEQDILEVLEELLDMCQVTTASTFDQAKTLLETNAFDIAILDIMGVNGYSLLEITNKKNIPAIMLTAHAFSADNLVRTIKEGAYAYVPKEEISRITTFLADALNAKKKGENPWQVWEERLPSSYFEKRWGAAWKNSDRDFWNNFRESIKTRNGKK
jgi:DNA-binding NtrC family response regulator